MMSKGEMWVFDSSCITQPQSTRSRKDVGSNPIWGSDFSEVPVGSIVTPFI